MTKHSLVTHQFVVSRLSYSPLTGIFRWRSIPQNTQNSGKVAGCRCETGIVIQLLGEKWTASRLAVFYMTGINPIHRIQHINGDQFDCRYINLRECAV